MQEVEAVTSHISHEEPLNSQFRNYASFIWYISRKEHIAHILLHESCIFHDYLYENV